MKNVVDSHIVSDIIIIKNFIFNELVPFKLLRTSDTRFASIMMLKSFKFIKQDLQSISSEWQSHREDDASVVMETILKEEWWDKVDNVLPLLHIFMT